MADVSGLLVALLAAPVVAVVAIAVLPDRAVVIARGVAALVAAGWVLLAAADDRVTAGDLVADPILAATATGLALLVASITTYTPIGAGAGLLVVTVLPTSAAFEPDQLPDRRLAAGIVVVALLATVRLWTERVPVLGRVLVILAGLVLASGLIGEDQAEALTLAVAGSTIAVLAIAVWITPGRLLVPAGMLVVARIAPDRATPDGTDWVLLVTAVLLVAGALVLHAVRARPAVQRLPLAGALAGTALLAFDVAELRSAGALLAAGAVLALAGRHPAALVAMVPGVVAAIDAAGLATQPEHAAVAAGIAAVVVVATVDGPRAAPVREPFGPITAFAVAFAVIPLWGWAGASLDDYRRAVTVAIAVAVPVLLLTLPVWRDRLQLPDLATARSARSAAQPPVPGASGVPHPDDVVDALTAPPAVRIRRRGSRIAPRPLGAPSHGTALQDVQDAESVTEEAHREATDGTPS